MTRKKTPWLLVLPLVLLCGCVSPHPHGHDLTPGYQNKSLGLDDRVEDLLTRMTLSEKIELLGGVGFETKAIARLGIPALHMTDGPVGVRWGRATAFPAGIAMAATWDPELIARLGAALAQETKAKGRNVILGPCVNIARLPMAGRNFESFGEDPYLASRLAVHYINGVQKENVVATVKHLAANNQEYQRDSIDTIIDERALNEIYLPAFKDAVEEAKVLAVMSAYNKVNGHYCSENKYLLLDKVKNEWGFKGIIMSDWGATQSSIPTFNNGLDLEMPSATHLSQENLQARIANGALQESTLDDKVRRLIRVMLSIGLFDGYQYDATTLNNDEHRTIAAEVAKAGIVLLKNTPAILPLDLNTVRSVAVIGAHSRVAQTGGGGSSMVSAFHAVSPFDALRDKIGDTVRLTFAPGYRLSEDITPIDARYLFIDKDGARNGLAAEYFANKDLQGAPRRPPIDPQLNFAWGDGPPLPDFPSDNFSARWTGYLKVNEAGRYALEVASDDGVRLYVDDRLVIDEWRDHDVARHSFSTELAANVFYKIRLEYYENTGGASVALGWQRPHDDLLAEAIRAAKNSDIAIVFAGTGHAYESEGFDREDLRLPNDQDTVIQEIARANQNTIVVLATGSPVMMDAWLASVRGVLETWFAGEQAGNAIADVLLGATNPSGKLPMTFPQRWEDCSAFASYKKEDGRTTYSDGIYVGYRHFERQGIKPLFPFGYGLSYTTFHYSDLTLSSRELAADGRLTVRFALENQGHVSGAETAQLYIKSPSTAIDHPEKELKRFQKVTLQPGERKIITFELDEKAFRFFDPNKKAWSTEAGEFAVLIGSSSAHIELTEKFRLRR